MKDIEDLNKTEANGKFRVQPAWVPSAEASDGLMATAADTTTEDMLRYRWIAQLKRVDRMIEHEKRYGVTSLGVHREIIALSRSAEGIIRFQIKQKGVRNPGLNEEESLSEEELEKLSPTAQEFAKLDTVDRLLILQLVRRLEDAVFKEVALRKSDAAKVRATGVEELQTDKKTADEMKGTEDSGTATNGEPPTTEASAAPNADVYNRLNPAMTKEILKMPAIELLRYCQIMQRARVDRMIEQEERLGLTFPRGHEQIYALSKISDVVQKCETAIIEKNLVKASPTAEYLNSANDKYANMDSIDPDVFREAVDKFHAMIGFAESESTGRVGTD